MTIYHNYLITPHDFPYRFIYIGGNENAITKLEFVNEKIHTPYLNEPLKQATKEVEEYFAGKKTVFTIPLLPSGTEFQKKVWQQLTYIKFGQTCSYKQIAVAVASVNYCRAVGMANGKNPIPLIIPCHRVIGHDGSLAGFSCGVATKQWLLNHEQHVMQHNT